MPKATKQEHKEGHTLTDADKQKDMEARGEEFRTRFTALQMELKMMVVPAPVMNPNGTIGAMLNLVDTKYRKPEAQESPEATEGTASE